MSEGILELVERRRISAVGCMMTQPTMNAYAAKIKSRSDHIDIGVHFVLTDMQGLSDIGTLPSIGTLTKKALFGTLRRRQIRSELELQLSTFERLFGRQPDFIDGHHHVHQLPGIRQIVLDLIEETSNGKRPYLRNCFEEPKWLVRRGVSPLKAYAIGLLGARVLKSAKSRKILTNDGFAGIYDLSGKVPYDRLFDAFTDGLRPGGLVMCHPGKTDDELRSLDSLTEQREVELAYFLSDQFLDLLEHKNLKLARFSAAIK